MTGLINSGPTGAAPSVGRAIHAGSRLCRALAGSLALLAGLAALPAAAADSDIGVAASVVSRVEGSAQGERVIDVGSQIFQNETIRTAPDGRAQLLFLDETVMTVGADAELTLDSYVFDPSQTSGEVVMKATRGAFRFITGNLQSASYRIDTPVATIGIRGTIIDLVVEPDGSVSIVLVEGGATIRSLGGAGGTVELTEAGDYVRVPVGGDATAPAPAPDWVLALLDWVRANDTNTARIELPDDIPIDPANLGEIIDQATPAPPAPMETTETCFAAGTRVLMADGSEKPIEQVSDGDRIMTFQGDGPLRPGRVVKAHRFEDAALVRMNGLSVAPDHSFLTAEGRFMTPERLGRASQTAALGTTPLPALPSLVGADGAPVAFAGMSALPGRHTVYNLTVQGGQGFVAGGLRAHQYLMLVGKCPKGGCPE